MKWPIRAAVFVLTLLFSQCGTGAVSAEALVLREADLDPIYRLDPKSSFDLDVRYRDLCGKKASAAEADGCYEKLSMGMAGGYDAVFRALAGMDVAFYTVRSTVFLFPKEASADTAYEKLSDPRTGFAQEFNVPMASLGDRSVVRHAAGADDSGYFNYFRVVLQIGRAVVEVEVDGTRPASTEALKVAERDDFAYSLAQMVEKRVEAALR